jgi:hypothetical protein
MTSKNEHDAAKIYRQYNEAEYYKGKPEVVNLKIIPFLESIGFPKTSYMSPTGYGRGHGSDQWRVSSGLSKIERLAVIAGYEVEISSETRHRWLATYSRGYWGHRAID